jgi:ABC-type lipoprotein release transport system permease subunit
MTLLTIIASIITGTIVGGWLAMVVASAAMSRSQEHMEKRVRYWQAQAQARAQTQAQEVHKAGHAELQPGAPDYWPRVLAGK